MTSFVKICAVPLLAISLTLPLPCLADSANITLNEVNNVGYRIIFNAPFSQLRGQPFLLRARGIPLTNVPLERIKRDLLHGPSGSMLPLTVLDDSGKKDSFEIPINFDTIATDNADSIFTLRNVEVRLEQLSRQAPMVNWSTQGTSNDLMLKAQCLYAIENISAPSPEVPDSKLCIALQCILLSQSIGDFDAADRYTEVALSLFSKPEALKGNLSFPFASLINNLVVLGKTAEATSICEGLASPAVMASSSVIDTFKILEALSTVNTPRASAAQSQLADRLNQQYSKDDSKYNDNLTWFAAYLVGHNHADQALKILAQTEKHLRQQTAPATFVSIQKLTQCLYLKARAEALSGKLDEAEKVLNEIKICFKSLPVDQQQTLDQIPLYFPKPDNVRSALTELTTHKSIAQPPPIYCLPSYYPFSDASKGISNLPLAQLFSTAVKSGEKNSAVDNANKLVAAYEAEGVDPLFRDRFVYNRQNLFCTVLRAARAIADRGWRNESNALLAKLDTVLQSKKLNKSWTEMAREFIANEKTYNDFANQTIQKKAGTDSRVMAQHPRIMSMNYYYGQELERAIFFNTLALKMETEEEAEKAKNSPAHAVSVNTNGDRSEQNAKFVLRMNRAAIFARLRNPIEARKYVADALTIDYDNRPAISAAMVETAIAFQKDGQTKDATALLNKAITNDVGNQAFAFGALKQKLAEFQKPNTVTTAISERDKAVDSVNNDAMSEKLDAEARKTPLGIERIRLWEKALALMSDTNKKKPELILNLVCEKKNFNEERLVKEALADGKKSPRIVFNDSDSLKQFIAKTPTPSADELTALLKAADLATAQKSPEAGTYWMRLAVAESLNDRLDSAFEHAQKSIDMYGPEDARLTTPGQIMGSYNPAIIMATHGASDKGDQLFREAVARVESVQGHDSFQAQTQSAFYFAYCINDDKYSKALEVLDRLLKGNLNQGTYVSQSREVSFCRCGPVPIQSSFDAINVLHTTCQDCFKRKQFDIAQQALARLEKAEIDQFSAKDYRTALTRSIRAQGFSLASENDKAERYYRLAKPVLEEHRQWVGDLNNDFQRILRLNGKQAEIDAANEMLEKDRRQQIEKAEIGKVTPPNDDLAEHHLKLSREANYPSPESVALREKAVSAMTAKNPRKAKTIMEIMWAKKGREEEKLATKTKGTKIPAAENDSLLTSIAQSRPPFPFELTDTEAALALTGQDIDRESLLHHLAELEARSRMLDSAIKHERLAIAEYRNSSPGGATIYSVMCVPLVLAAFGDVESGNILFKEALARVKKVHGEKSEYAQIELSYYFNYCINTSNDELAQTVLEELLNSDFNAGEYISPRASDANHPRSPWPMAFDALERVIYQCAQYFKPGTFDKGQKYLDQIINAELKQFPADDYRIAYTRAVQAEGYSIAGENIKAETNYRLAFSVMSKLGLITELQKQDFFKVLKANGKEAEIATLDEQYEALRAEAIQKENPHGMVRCH